MRNLTRAMVLTFMMMLAATCAWSAASISWTDALGSHTVPLNCIDNPDYSSSEPFNIELPFIWSASINVTMDTLSPMQFSITGNFADNNGEIWDQVRLAELVVNKTTCNWSDFHMAAQNGNGEFYNVFLIEPGWNWNSTGGNCDMAAADLQYYKAPTDTFNYGVNIWADCDYNTGNGSITFLQYPTYPVPEPASSAVLLSGMMGLLGFIKKRKA